MLLSECLWDWPLKMRLFLRNKCSKNIKMWMTSSSTFASARWPGTRIGKFFFKFSPLCFCWFVYWLLVIAGSYQWRGAPMESKSPVAAGTKLSRFGTRNLEIASRPWGGTRIGKFFQVFPSMVQLIRVLTSYNFSLYSVAWSPDGKQIASGSYDRTIKIWDSRTGDCQSTLSGHSDE